MTDYKDNCKKADRAVLEETFVGKQTKTSIAVCYMKNIADDSLIQEVKKKIRQCVCR